PGGLRGLSQAVTKRRLRLARPAAYGQRDAALARARHALRRHVERHHPVPAAEAATGYKMRFPVEVKDGVLSGQYGTEGQPSSVTLKGRIQPDGQAIVDARGVTGDPNRTVGRVSRGSTYSYSVDARF